jgi:peroxiredoxin
MDLIIVGIALPWLVVGLGCWLGYQLLRQNGRLLLHLERLEGRLAQLTAAPSAAPAAPAPALPAAAGASGNGDHGHKGNRDLADSKIQREGLPAGTPAPDFLLPALDGGQLSLAQFRGRRVLLVFSDPQCGPCNQLAPPLEQFHRRTGDVQVLMISRGDREANRAKAVEHGMTFPIVLQKQWEVSREYAMFATPIAYLIDEAGAIAAEVALGVEPILALLARAEGARASGERPCGCGKPLGECGCARKNGRHPAVKAHARR